MIQVASKTWQETLYIQNDTDILSQHKLEQSIL